MEEVKCSGYKTNRKANTNSRKFKLLSKIRKNRRHLRIQGNATLCTSARSNTRSSAGSVKPRRVPSLSRKRQISPDSTTLTNNLPDTMTNVANWIKECPCPDTGKSSHIYPIMEENIVDEPKIRIMTNLECVTITDSGSFTSSGYRPTSASVVEATSQYRVPRFVFLEPFPVERPCSLNLQNKRATSSVHEFASVHGESSAAHHISNRMNYKKSQNVLPRDSIFTIPRYKRPIFKDNHKYDFPIANSDFRNESSIFTIPPYKCPRFENNHRNDLPIVDSDFEFKENDLRLSVIRNSGQMLEKPIGLYRIPRNEWGSINNFAPCEADETEDVVLMLCSPAKLDEVENSHKQQWNHSTKIEEQSIFSRIYRWILGR